MINDANISAGRAYLLKGTTLRKLLRRRVTAGEGLTARETPDGQTIISLAPEATAHPFKLRAEAADPFNPAVSVAPGTVDGIMPEMAGNALDHPAPPAMSFAAAGRYVLALRIEWIPHIAEDYDGHPYLAPGGRLRSAPEVVAVLETDWPPDESPPDALTGADGIYFQRIGHVAVVPGAVTGSLDPDAFNDTLRGSVICSFCPPDTLTIRALAWETPVAP